MKESAEAANDPVFGSIMESRKESQNRDRTVIQRQNQRVATPKVTTLATHGGSDSCITSNSTRPVTSQVRKNYHGEACPSCNGAHGLLECRDFSNKSHEERIEVLRKNRICDNCFQKGHFAVGCAERAACTVDGCRRKHQTIIHLYGHRYRNSNNVDARARTIDGRTQCNVIGAGDSGYDVTASDKRVLLKIVPVKVKGQGQDEVVETYALLDSGSDVSLCDRNLVEQLGVSGVERNFFMTTQEMKNSSKIGLEVGLTVEAIDGEGRLSIPRVWAIDSLNVSERSIPHENDVNKWPHLQDIRLPKIDQRRVRLLIGCNVPDAFVVSEERRGNEGEPYAAKTTLGWTVLGPTDKIEDKPSFQVNFIRLEDKGDTSRANMLLCSQLEKFWKTDFDDSISDSRVTMSIEDKRALELMDKSVRKVDGHYQLALPWKQRPPILPNNRNLADHRMRQLRRRLLSDDGLFGKYRATINDYLSKGYARKIPDSELAASEGSVWYLPHHPVVHKQKPDKVRVVFDCAAKYQGTSLNDNLLQGPDLTNSLNGVLTRFRQEPVAVVADIEAMFHQVLVDPKDCNALRFLWWPEDDLTREPTEHQMLVHLFGATSSPTCSNFSLRKTAIGPEIIRTVQRNFYVDDCLKSERTTDKAVAVAKKTSELLTRGGFKLTKWISNKREVIEAIPKKDRAKSILGLELDKLPIERTLGTQ